MPNPQSLQLVGEFVRVDSTPHANPTAAYAAWAAEIGVSDITSLPGLVNGDDSMAVVTLGFIPLSGGISNKMLQSTEGGIGLYYNEPATTTSNSRAITATSPQVSVTRFYGTSTPPAIILSSKLPSQDAKSTGTKWQQAGTTAIIYVRTEYYGSTADPTEIAVRISPENIEVVTWAPSAGATRYFQVFFFDQDNTTSYIALADFGRLTQQLNVGEVYHYVSGPPVRYEISGVVRNDAGVPSERTVRLYDRTTGALVSETTSDPTTGVFVFEVFTVSVFQIVALDDEIDTQYNDLIVSRVTPVQV